ncbi:MAG: hypothetical protein WD208_08000 [Dehalococcoidia bacterium]
MNWSPGIPSVGVTFDELDIAICAGAICNNGLTWPFSSTNYGNLHNTTFFDIGTGEVFML